MTCSSPIFRTNTLSSADPATANGCAPRPSPTSHEYLVGVLDHLIRRIAIDLSRVGIEDDIDLL